MIDKASLLTKINDYITTNGAMEITGAELNELLQDFLQSYPNRIDDAALLGLADYNPAVVYKAGMGAFVNKVLKRALFDTTGTYDATKWENAIIRSTGANGLVAYAPGGQTGALTLTAQVNILDTVGAVNASVKLLTGAIDDEYLLINNGANDAAAFPAVGQQHYGLAVNVAFTLFAGTQARFKMFTTGIWRQI